MIKSKKCAIYESDTDVASKTRINGFFQTITLWAHPLTSSLHTSTETCLYFGFHFLHTKFVYFVIFNDAISISMGSKKLNNTRCAEFTYRYWKTCISWDFFFLYRKMMRKVDFQDFFKTCICRFVRDLSTDFPFMQKNYRSDNLPFYCKRHKNGILPDKCAGLGSHTCIMHILYTMHKAFKKIENFVF